MFVKESFVHKNNWMHCLEGFTQFGKKPRLGQLLYKDIRGTNEAWGADGKVDSNDWDYLSRKGKATY